MQSSLDGKQLRRSTTRKWRELRWVEVAKSLDWSTHLCTEIIGLALMWDQPRSCRWLNIYMLVLVFLKMKMTAHNYVLFKSAQHLDSVFFYWSVFICKINHQFVSYKYLLLLFILLLCTGFQKRKIKKKCRPHSYLFCFKSVATLQGGSYSRPCKRAQSGSAAPVSSFLEACNLIFENGLLSRRRINRVNSPVIQNIKKGMDFFEKWCQAQPWRNRYFKIIHL